MEITQTTTNHTCCGCGKSCRRTAVIFGVSIIILSGILAMIAPPVIMKFGIPQLGIEPAVEEMSIQSFGEMGSTDMAPAEAAPVQDEADAVPSADVSVQ